MKGMIHFGALAGLAMIFGSAHAISLGQIDDFEDGTTHDWTEGGPSPNQPFNVADGGPDGAGDNYLENFASGLSGPGGALVMFNFSQWTGNYQSAAVRAIGAQVANFGGDDIYLRIAFEGGAGTRYGSTSAFVLPADAVWRQVSFALDAGSLSLISGSDSLDTVLSGVTQLRILNAQAAPDWIGDFTEARLGMDDITARAAVPLPGALWMMAGALLGALAGARRRGH